MKRSRILILVSLCTIGIIAFFFASKRQDLRPRAQEKPLALEPQSLGASDATPDKYRDVIVKLEAERAALASRYHLASSAEQANVVAEARTIVTRSIYTEIFPYWYGTP
jgi:hypothetical protein